ncbi:MAG TPA: acyl-CoA carboxylase subunit epsilon [Jatrophihabitantaceae bacterium]|jgi:hypothetical protein|nr:acyl-CoA carboxylase subunit epsilon [Jatrophihabitantaceae bacterium]
MSDDADDVVHRPALRIVRGAPTPEELAVVTAVVAAAGSGAEDAPEPARRGRWSDPAWQHRPAPYPGPGAWASSFR